MSGLDVDTRSDIYSLGVLFDELPTGSSPFDQERLREAPCDEIRRMIREEEPPRPSTGITTLGEAATTISAQRKTDPAKLSQLLRRGVDWIVMKALQKDRTRCYQTASETVVVPIILGGIAVLGEGYTISTTTLSIPPGRDSATFTITALRDPFDPLRTSPSTSASHSTRVRPRS